MRTGTVLSVMLHGAVAALTLMSWRNQPLEPPQEFHLVDVEMVTIASETNIAPAAPVAAPPEPAPPPPEPEPTLAPPPPPDLEPEPQQPPPPKDRPPERQAALPPKTEPRPQAKPKPEPKEPEPKKPEPKKPEATKPKAKEPEQPKQKVAETKPADKKRPEKPKKPKEEEFSLDAIGAAADKLAKNQPKPERQASLPEQSSASRAAAGRATRMTATEIDVLRSTISKCWNMPAGAPNPETLVVRLKLFLNQDGTVARPPELIDTAGRLSSDPYFRAAAESAMRAVQICAPYQLPDDKYDDWSEITINFRPPF